MSFGIQNTKSQLLEQKYCFKGEKTDAISYLNHLNDNNNLLLLSSYSKTQDYLHSDSSLYPFYWLYKFDDNFDIVWKKRLEFSNYSILYFLVPSFFPPYTMLFSGLGFLHIPYKFSNNNQLILSYLYKDSTINQSKLLFYSLDCITGQLIDTIHSIDTLPANIDELSYQIEETNTIRKSDSTYFLAVNYSNVHQDNLGLGSVVLLKTYFINTKTNQIIKNEFQNRNLFFSANNKNYVISLNFDEANSNTNYRLYFLDDVGTTIDSIIFHSDAVFIQDISYNLLNDSTLQLFYYSMSDGYAKYNIINLNSKTVENMPLIQNTDTIGDVIRYTNWNDKINQSIIQSKYLFVNNNSYISEYKNSVIKFKENGIIDRVINMSVPFINYNSINHTTSFLELDNEPRFINIYNVDFYNDTVGITFKDKINCYDENGNKVWETNFNDSVIFNNERYKYRSLYKYEKLINQNKVIVILSYANYDSSEARFRTKTYLLDLRNGIMEDFILDNDDAIYYHTIVDNSNQEIFFFKNSDTICEANSLQDIALYKYHKRTTSIKNNITFNNNFSVYPNPSNGIINIINTNESIVKSPITISVFNLKGNKIFETINSSSSNFKIDISSFAKGFYIINISDGITKTTNKIIIQ